MPIKHHCIDGTVIDFTQPKIGHFDISLLLTCIGRETRFQNQVPWSVLQHSLAMGKACEILFGGNTLLIQHGYLHDLHEAIVKDVPTPVKRAVGKAWYQMENQVASKLMEALRVGALGDDDEKLLKQLDRVMAFVEGCHLHSSEWVELCMSEEEFKSVPLDIVVHATTAFNMVVNLEIWKDPELAGVELKEEIIDLFRRVIYLTVG